MTVREQQRKLGAIEGEVVAGRPAVVGPSSLADFDGWTAADVVEWLGGLRADFRRLRLGVGLGLWVLRDRASEVEYGLAVKLVADRLEVDVATLRRWRNKAEEHWQLGIPSGADNRVRGQVARRRANLSTGDSPSRAPESQQQAPDVAPDAEPPPAPRPNPAPVPAVARALVKALSVVELDPDVEATVRRVARPGETPSACVNRIVRTALPPPATDTPGRATEVRTFFKGGR